MRTPISASPRSALQMDSQRIDKWLWAARFYKTRSLAADDLALGRVQINGQEAKASREVRPGHEVQLRQGGVTRTVIVRGLSAQRGPATVAQQLYEETPESLQALAAAREQRRYMTEPAHSQEQGRPTKRDRRELDRQSRDGWNERWSASLD